VILSLDGTEQKYCHIGILIARKHVALDTCEYVLFLLPRTSPTT